MLLRDPPAEPVFVQRVEVLAGLCPGLLNSVPDQRGLLVARIGELPEARPLSRLSQVLTSMPERC
ncbi:hypothetical protein D7294_20935 [Streptomyces hoynatensis]|uniref:Uncharacterized protein n=1 Tax=Streptomyces hoynatensis TaxID=1141874 RepID=A0A3A9YW70_9ACTN|nr:hypothetical protein D7294_20935 [Streptomyces hoynatensis]